MSFAGHVFDMIRRNREDRERLRQLRGQMSDSTKYAPRIPDVPAEEFEKAERLSKEREQEDERYFSHASWLIMIVVAAMGILLSWILKMLVF